MAALTASRVGDIDAECGFEGTVNHMLIWIVLGAVYLMCWIFFGLSTFRKGHYLLFWVGFFLPFLWIIGAMMGPTAAPAARA